MNFELSLNEEIELYLATGLDPNELFVLRLLFLARGGDSSYLLNYVSNSKIELRQVLLSLQHKGVINKSYHIPDKGESFNPNDVPFSKVFLKSYIRETHELGKELFEKYPEFMNIGGKLCSIKNITKANFYNFEDFFNYYAKTIKLSGVTHEYIMNQLDFAIENNLINFTILEFVASRKWNAIAQLREGGLVNGYNNSELI